MSRSAAARADHDHQVRGSRRHAPGPRRVSGPAGPARARALAMSDAFTAPHPNPLPRHRAPVRPPLRLAAGGAAVALRVAEAAMEVSGSRTMDRLVRSRAWVVIVAFGLMGIVAMQVSLLKLNNGIGRAVETAATLERSNATLRGEVSRLSSGDRIQALAGARGFVMPEPADVTFLRAGGLGSDGARAARRMRTADPQVAGPAGSAVIPSTVIPVPPETAATAAPAAGDTTVAATAPAATGATAPVQAVPAATAPAAVPAQQTATATAAAPVPTSSGGVTVP